VSTGSTVCPNCGGLNSAGEKECFRCKKALPGPMARGASGLLDTAFGREFRMTKLYVGLCVAVFLAILAATKQLEMLGGRDSELLRWGAVGGLLGRIEPWRYLSAMFVHFGVLHIIFNGMALWDFGRYTEERVGGGRFVVIFISTGIAGFLLSDFWYSLQQVARMTAGASGGLFGLVGFLIGYMYAARDPAWKSVLMRTAIYAVIFAIAMPVNNAAHVGGFVTGFPLGWVFFKERQPHKRTRIFNIVAAVLVVASFASIALSHHSPAWRIQRQLELEHGDPFSS
jgi:membrane associated rhomboid family serine protease